MAIANFESLCAGFCELVKVTPPPLKADDQGLVAFHLVLRGQTVNLVHRPDTSPDHFFVLFDLGPISHGSPDTQDSAARFQALLDANYVLLELNPPVFSRNPATGEAVLQYVFSLFEITPNHLYELIDEGIDQISRWLEVSTGDAVAGEHVTAAVPPMAMLHRIA
jgi:hypothetical protein